MVLRSSALFAALSIELEVGERPFTVTLGMEEVDEEELGVDDAAVVVAILSTNGQDRTDKEISLIKGGVCF